VSSTQVEIELLRNLGSAAIHMGQQYHQYADFLANGAAGPIVAGTTAAAPPAPGVTPPPPFPAAPPAPGTVAAPPGANAAAAAPSAGRKRRTKAEIEADEAAVKAGYVNHADMLARSGGAPAAAVPTGAVQPVPGVSGHVPAPLPPGTVAAPPTPVAPPPSAHDTLQAALTAFGQAVENTWPGQGHGNGQMGLVVARMGVQNIQAVPAENIQGWTDWIVDITNRFRADPSKLSELTR
jgi:hypothetical protein